MHKVELSSPTMWLLLHEIGDILHILRGDEDAWDEFRLDRSISRVIR